MILCGLACPRSVVILFDIGTTSGIVLLMKKRMPSFQKRNGVVSVNL
jgi:hypothetical protein